MQNHSIKALRPGRRAILQSLLCGAAAGVGVIPQAAFGNEPEFLLDFSYAGYGAGLIDPPVLPAASRLTPSGGDDTDQINRALERLATSGRDGAVLLGPGRFYVDGQIRLRGAGVALRGAPNGATTIVARGVSRRTLIDVSDGQETDRVDPSVRHDFSDPMGVGYLDMRLVDTAGLKPGADILIHRPSTAEWIAALGMNTATGNFAADRLHWKPGTRDLVWRRTVTSVDAEMSEIRIDAPITYSLGPDYGDGEVTLANSPGAVRLGVEDLVLESAFDGSRPKDEEHSWIAIAIDGVSDAWVRSVTTRHFVSSAVRVGHRARRVTVDRVRCLAPVSEIGGYRRQSFVIEGQQVLVVDCHAENGLNDFSTGMLAAGPNVFLRCTARRALGDSGGWESFSPGVLFDNVRIEGAGLILGKDPGRVQGAGWTSGNSTFWNVVADRLVLEAPPGSMNFSFERSGSLYERQKRERLAAGSAASRAEDPVEHHVPLREDGERKSRLSKPARTTNGRFTLNGKGVWGGALNHGWWRGQTYPEAALDHGRSISRFVPGRTGRGLTEDLDVLADDMVEARTPFFQSCPALWYDRRRDDHALTERPDANVWAPFYEMPWARSGTGKAYDGLSKYDLTKYNPWYFERLQDFTQACDQRGLIHFHNLYNTHNLLETAAHWTDFPWRPFNNVNDTGLPEPMPLEAGNTVHIANQFYSMDYPPLAQLHRAYINKVLDEVGGARNIILGVGFQFAGPLAFQQAFLDLVADWETRNGKTVRIALTTTKDITDAILEDPVRGRQVEVIDQRYWQYRPDGSLWAPKGGRNLAFREMITTDFGRSGDSPPDTTAEQAYRQVREYTERYPAKAVVAWHNGVTAMPALMAGAAQVLNRNPSAGHSQGRSIDRTPVDVFVQESLADRLATMSPANDLLAADQKAWALADGARATVLLYSTEGPALTLREGLRGYAGQWFNPLDGKTLSFTETGPVFTKPDSGAWALLLKKG